MILVDGNGHMVSTVSAEELHEFASKIGLKQEWYQDHPKHPHYDLTSRFMMNHAYNNGAEPTSSKDLVQRAWWAMEEMK